jgi:hypothetical protein
MSQKCPKMSHLNKFCRRGPAAVCENANETNANILHHNRIPAEPEA